MIAPIDGLPSNVIGFVASGEVTAADVEERSPTRHALNVSGYLIPGEVKVFELDERDAATAWVTG